MKATIPTWPRAIYYGGDHDGEYIRVNYEVDRNCDVLISAWCLESDGIVRTDELNEETIRVIWEREWEVMKRVLE